MFKYNPILNPRIWTEWFVGTSRRYYFSYIASLCGCLLLAFLVSDSIVDINIKIFIEFLLFAFYFFNAIGLFVFRRLLLIIVKLEKELLSR